MKRTRGWIYTVSNPPAERPLLVYDGDCSFCRRWVVRYRSAIGERIDYQPFQKAADAFPEIPAEQFRQSLHFIEPDGSVSFAAKAALKPLRLTGWPRALWFAYRWMPGASVLADHGYFIVADHRNFFDRLMRWFFGRSDEPASAQLARMLFLRGLALVYLLAFASLWFQVDALVGDEGILPAGEYFNAAHEQLGSRAWWALPSVGWLFDNDAWLQAACLVGGLASAALFAGLAPALMLLLAYGCYLSLSSAGQVFLQYQWDSLLLETGFLAIWLAPWSWRLSTKHNPPPSRLAMALVWFLLFRLMFFSGVVKLQSLDPAWLDWTALQFHYETQPIVNPLSWFIHHAPGRFHVVSCGTMFFIELIVPFFFFAPRRLRMLAALATIALQAAIILTGNYGFFNLLAIVLCLPLIDDVYWRALAAKLPVMPTISLNLTASKEILIKRILSAPALAVLLMLGVTQTALLFFPAGYDLAAPRWMLQSAQPFHLCNRYGLFAVMTKERPEIVLEGSLDGVEWRAYDFRWKADRVDDRPRFIAPHMPRVDWQMWFASLGTYRRNSWLIRLQEELLEGNPLMMRFFSRNPFPEQPPKYIRAVLYDFRFSDWQSGFDSGHWWRAERQGLYNPILTLKPQS